MKQILALLFAVAMIIVFSGKEQSQNPPVNFRQETIRENIAVDLEKWNFEAITDAAECKLYEGSSPVAAEGYREEALMVAENLRVNWKVIQTFSDKDINQIPVHSHIIALELSLEGRAAPGDKDCCNPASC